MERLTPQVVAVVLVSLVTVRTALAQQPTGRAAAGTGMPTLRLLTQKSVQDDLKMTSDQVQKLTAAFKKMRKLRDDAEDQGKKLDFPELMKINDQLVKDIVTPEQNKRLQQIRLQIGGPRAFADPALAKELKITEAQATKLKALAEDARKQIQKAFDEAETRQAAQDKVSQVNRDVARRIQELLTSEQRSRWQSMTGAPFTGMVRLGAPQRDGK
jgi:hypothetical protein